MYTHGLGRIWTRKSETKRISTGKFSTLTGYTFRQSRTRGRGGRDHREWAYHVRIVDWAYQTRVKLCHCLLYGKLWNNFLKHGSINKPHISGNTYLCDDYKAHSEFYHYIQKKQWGQWSSPSNLNDLGTCEAGLPGLLRSLRYSLDTFFFIQHSLALLLNWYKSKCF